MKAVKNPGLALLAVVLFSMGLADSASAQSTMRRKDAAPPAAAAPAAADAAPAAKPHKSKKAKKAAPAVAPQTNIESHQPS